MELQNLDHQLKMAIQNHQLLVSKMKNDPQNGALQKQLHDLQSQIKGLSEKQKQVVQQLRKDLEIKQQHHQQQPKRSASLINAVLPQASMSLASSTAVGTTVAAAMSVVPTKSTRASLSAGLIFPASKVTVSSSPAISLTTVTTNGSGNIHHHRPAILVRSTAGSPTLAPSPTPCVADIQQPAIRVPQYPIIHLIGGVNVQPLPSPISLPLPPPLSSSSQQQQLPAGNKDTTSATASNLLPHAIPPPASAVVTLPSKSPDKPSTPSPPLLVPHLSPIAEKSSSASQKPRLSDVDTAKAKFMSALGLVTHDVLTELQSRKSERKRRATANPQFSYHNWDHADKRSNLSYLSGCLPPGFKRPRGRPRVGLSTTPTDSRPSTPEDFLHNGPSNGLSIKPLRNGIREECDFCLICREKDNLLNLVCEICTQPCHSTCLAERLADDESMPPSVDSASPSCPSPFVCSRCLNLKKKNHGWPRSLAAVHSYLAHKAAKEEEKRRLMKRGVELKAERSQLEQRAKQLSEALSQYVHKRNAVLSNTKDTLESIERIKNAVKVLQSSS